jgi:hypothetical protein
MRKKIHMEDYPDKTIPFEYQGVAYSMDTFCNFRGKRIEAGADMPTPFGVGKFLGVFIADGIPGILMVLDTPHGQKVLKGGYLGDPICIPK